MQLGQRSDLKQQLKVLAVEIDAAVRSVLLHFEPLDMDLQYISKIMPDRLEILIRKIKVQKKEYDRINAEIKHLNEELGNGNGE